MNKYNVSILGRKYILVTEKDKGFAEKLENVINKDLGKIRAELVQGDFVDSFIMYIFQLFEQFEETQEQLKESEEKKIVLKKKIGYLTKEVTGYIEKLTGA